MDSERWKRVAAIVDRVLESPEAEREHVIREACGDDEDLRVEVEDLLSRMGGGLSFLDAGAVDFSAPAFEVGPDAREGERVDRYRLVRRLARGGMSVVYLAERDDSQFEQQVALKILEYPGSDQDEGVRRFDVERRILAALDHPHIAKILDGGVTPSGRPYLVMEYVDGKSIVEHCNDLDLSVEERLRLFEDVCAAVQHAHQRLVVHRDLKPGNVLVRADGAVKLLDFGIAKLLDPLATGVSGTVARTRAGVWLLTPEYASPEQVRGSEITTATDVFSLGVLLYELLTGERPWDLRGKSPAEVERIVSEDEAPRPSTLASTDTRRLRGDLDTIVEKAMSKNPAARYESPSAMAEDVRSHRQGRSIEARSTSIAYRARRQVWRHRVAFGVALLALAFLAFHTVQITRERNVARREAAKAEQVSTFLIDLFSVSDPDESPGGTISARELLDRSAHRMDTELKDQPLVKASMLDVMGSVYERLGLYDEATPLVEQALAIRRELYGDRHEEIAASLDQLAELRGERGDYDEAESLYRQSLGMQRELAGSGSLGEANTLDQLGVILSEASRYEEAMEAIEQALAIRQEQLEPEHVDIATTLSHLAFVHHQRSEYSQAEPLFREALRIRRAALGDEHSAVALSFLNLGDALQNLGDYDGAEPLIREGLRITEKLFGEDHPAVANGLNKLGVLLFRAGAEGAEPALQRSLMLRRRRLGENHPTVAKSLNDLAACHDSRADYAAAEPLFRESLAIYRALLGDDHAAISIMQANIAGACWGREKFAEAERLFRDAVRGYREHFGEENSRVANALVGLAMSVHDGGDPAGAEPIYRDGLAMALAVSEEGHFRVAVARLELGRLLVHTGRADEAEALLREATRVHREVLGAEHPIAARTDVWWGACLARQGKPDEADEVIRLAVRRLRDALPGDHPFVRRAEAVAEELRPGSVAR